MAEATTGRRKFWLAPTGVFVAVVAFELWLVAAAGTDIPFQDQWGIEGGWLYPAWHEGSLRAADLVRPINEHRLLWTHLLNLGLFVVNGQWDPLVQLTAIAFLRGGCAAGLAGLAGAGSGALRRWAVAVAVTVAFLPQLAWHNVLWGIESHAQFVLGLALLALALLGAADRSPRRTVGGLAAGGAALLAMGPGALVPVALLGLVAIQVAETRRLDGASWRLAWPALLLLVAAWALRVTEPALAGLGAATGRQFLTAAGQVLGWPHGGQPWVALVLNLPLLLVVGGRVARRRSPAAGENFVLLAAGWSLAVGLAIAWRRGGGDELVTGVPSRYVDFLVLLPLANLWCAGVLARAAVPRWRVSARVVAVAWGLFLFIGWLGLSLQMMRGIILPRARDREAPVRLLREFQRADNPAVFAGQPRLLVPHPNLAVVRGVLHDPRLAGALPPSLQPERPLGPLSRAVRGLLRR